MISLHPHGARTAKSREVVIVAIPVLVDLMQPAL
jgi:hypothetical protein